MSVVKRMNEIREMGTPELISLSQEMKSDIAEMKRRIHMGEVQNTRSVRMKRRELARVLTVLGEHLSKERA